MTAPTNQLDGAMMTKDQIRAIFMAHGFTIKEGQTDLKQYVYDAAYALFAAAPAAIEREAMKPLTEEDVERQYENGIHIGSGLPRASCPCGFCAKHRFGFNVAAPLDKEEAVACAICSSDEPYTGTCGSNDPRALCKAAPSVAQDERSIPEDCDVRKILLRVVPGDGDGHEVYARNVSDVEALLAEMGERIEDFESRAASTSANVAQGWKLVPIEPTNEMTFIGQKHRYDSAWSIGAIYREMLAAAPPSQTADSKEKK